MFASSSPSLYDCHHRAFWRDCSVPSKTRLASGSRPSSRVGLAVETKSDRRFRTLLPAGRSARNRPSPISPATRRATTNSAIHERQIRFWSGWVMRSVLAAGAVYAVLALPIPATETLTRALVLGSRSDLYVTTYWFASLRPSWS